MNTEKTKKVDKSKTVGDIIHQGQENLSTRQIVGRIRHLLSKVQGRHAEIERLLCQLERK